MKEKTNSWLLLPILIGLVIVVYSCNKNNEEANKNPTCVITNPLDAQEIMQGETVTISVDATDADGSIIEVQFYINEIAKGNVLSFPYNFEWNTSSENIAEHTIRAKAIDNAGGEKSSEIVVAIIENEEIPISNFNADPISGNAPLTIQFTDLSANNPISWLWDFGDGNTSALQNPSHTYNAAGTYVVSLTVANNVGTDTETKVDFIVVSPAGTFTDPRDSQTYNIVVIGNQEWFAQNLNYDTYNSWCYTYNSGNCDEFGRLYTWEAAKIACPAGWHLPTDGEWKELEMYLGMHQSEADEIGWRGTDEGKKLKSTSSWTNGGNGTDEVGFSALPGGYRDASGVFYAVDNFGFWWAATPSNSTEAWGRSLHFNYDRVHRSYSIQAGGFSVRCVKD